MLNTAAISPCNINTTWFFQPYCCAPQKDGNSNSPIILSKIKSLLFGSISQRWCNTVPMPMVQLASLFFTFWVNTKTCLWRKQVSSGWRRMQLHIILQWPWQMSLLCGPQPVPKPEGTWAPITTASTQTSALGSFSFNGYILTAICLHIVNVSSPLILKWTITVISQFYQSNGLALDVRL